MLICVFGPIGSGKSLFATIYAYYCKWPKIVVDYTLDIPNKEIVSFSQDLLLNSELSDCLIIIDEAYLFADSRTSKSKENLILSWLTFQSRKKNCDILYCVQLFGSLDKRIRNLINFYVFCEYVENTYFKYVILDEHLIQINQFYLPYKTALMFFRLYDTNQIIKSDKLELLELKSYTGAKLVKKAESLFNKIKNLDTFKKLLKIKGVIHKTYIKSMLLELNEIATPDLIDILYSKLNLYKKSYKN